MDLFTKHYKLSPNNTPLKPLYSNLNIKPMISIEQRGFVLYPLVEKKNPPLGRGLYNFILRKVISTVDLQD
jgi:phage pi2 protein 07